MNELEKEIETIVVGMPYNMDGTKTIRAEVTEKFIHKLKCKYNKIKIETIDERLTTVAAHKTMNFLDINKTKKRYCNYAISFFVKTSFQQILRH